MFGARWNVIGLARNRPKLGSPPNVPYIGGIRFLPGIRPNLARRRQQFTGRAERGPNSAKFQCGWPRTGADLRRLSPDFGRMRRGFNRIGSDDPRPSVSDTSRGLGASGPKGMTLRRAPLCERSLRKGQLLAHRPGRVGATPGTLGESAEPPLLGIPRTRGSLQGVKSI